MCPGRRRLPRQSWRGLAVGSSHESYLDPGVHLFLLLQALLHPLFFLLLLLYFPGGRLELRRLFGAAPLQRRVHAGNRTLRSWVAKLAEGRLAAAG